MDKIIKSEKLEMDLQYFAEDDSAVIEKVDAQGSEDDSGGENDSVITLTEEEMQAKIDDAIKARLARQEREHQKQLEKVRQKARADAERYAKMTEDEKKQAEIEERIRELEAREKELNDRELLANIKADLMDKKLPVAFAKYLLELQDVEKIKESIEEIEGVWNDEIAEFKKASVRQKTPKDSDNGFRGKAKAKSKADFFNEGRKI